MRLCHFLLGLSHSHSKGPGLGMEAGAHEGKVWLRTSGRAAAMPRRGSLEIRGHHSQVDPPERARGEARGEAIHCAQDQAAGGRL